MFEALGQTETTELVSIPYEVLLSSFIEADKQTDQAGKEHGIHIELSQKMNYEDLSIDPNETINILKCDRVPDMDELIRETLKVCVEA